MLDDEKMVYLFDGENNRFGTPFNNYTEILFLETLDKEERKKAENTLKENDYEAYEDFLKWVEEWEECDRDYGLWCEKKLEEILKLYK
jgi:hypothetical protein